jgi:ArsR family transcriptional regulator
MAQRLKVMSHPERLLMLCRMDEGEVNVNELVAMTGLSQSGVSQHLAMLRAEDVVHVRIDAQTRWYSLKDRIVSGVIHAMCDLCEAGGARQAARCNRVMTRGRPIGAARHGL